MNWADWVIIGIVVVSALISLIRGFVREGLSLIIWASAAWVSLVFAKDVADLFSNQIHSPSIRLAISFVVLFLGVLVLGAILSYLVCLLVEKTGLTGTDRFIGVFFGLARGFLVVAVLILLAKLTSLPQNSWWQDSYLIPHFEPLESGLSAFMDAHIKQYLPIKQAKKAQAKVGNLPLVQPKQVDDASATPTEQPNKSQ